MAPRTIHRTLAGLALGLVVSAPQPGRADDYPACAKIENPLAYNQCLANQGPPAHGTRSIAPPPDADAPKGAWRAPAAAGRTGSTIQVSRARNGRMIVEFSMGGGSAGSHKRKETQ
jgi:hypothetical protein